MSSKKMVVLQSSDGEKFEVEEAVALESKTVKAMMEDMATEVYPLRTITAEILSKVVDYCNRHADKVAPAAELEAFDAEFIKDVKNCMTMFKLMQAAQVLKIPGLASIAGKAMADFVMSDPEEVDRVLNLYLTGSTI